MNPPLFFCANSSFSSTPHSCGAESMFGCSEAGTFLIMLCSMAPRKAGEDGWSVMVTCDADANTDIMEGKPVPI